MDMTRDEFTTTKSAKRFAGNQMINVCMRMVFPLWLVLLMIVSYSMVSAAEYRVASAADLIGVTDKLLPGDVLVMTNGDWKDQTLLLRGKGTVQQPITLRADTPGRVVLSGKSSLVMDGEYLIASGLLFSEGQGTKDGITLKGNHCRLTETTMSGGKYKFFVHLWGREHRVDHCYLAGKTSESPTLQIEVESEPNHHQIDFNHFGPRPPLGRNGGETIRIGYSQQSMNNSRTVVEHNLFEQCDGEIEIISNKSCENTYRANTFVACAGMLTLRHGNRCRVEGNFFLGQHKKSSGGIRIIGEDHTLINNYIDGVERGGFWVTCGVPDSPLSGYFRAKNCLIAFNTVVNSKGPCIDVSNGANSSQRSLMPQNITIANNLFVVAKGGSLLAGISGGNYQWLGNLVSGDAAIPSGQTGMKIVASPLDHGPNGLWRPTGASPVRGAAEGSYPVIKTDMDGQPRTGRWDVGSDQVSDSPKLHRPLTPADVGPAWRR